MSVLYFVPPTCNYCSRQKDCKIKLDKEFYSNLFGSVKRYNTSKRSRYRIALCTLFSEQRRFQNSNKRKRRY